MEPLLADQADLVRIMVVKRMDECLVLEIPDRIARSPCQRMVLRQPHDHLIPIERLPVAAGAPCQLCAEAEIDRAAVEPLAHLRIAAFQTARHTIYAERTHEREASQAAKEKLAEEADKLRDSREWKATTERFHLLMDAWKKAGSAGHEEDDRLWEKFNGAQHEFFERRNAHYQELDSLHAKARAKKQELIERLRALPEPDESWGASQWKAQTNQVHDLMTEWRAAGQAGREENDRLWEEFNGLRQKFFDAQHAHYAAVEAQYKKNAEAKQELIDTAKRVSAAMDFGPEATETMKGLDVKWKAIGYAGPKTNDALWESFHDAKEKFWLQKRAYHEARHEIAQKKSEEAIERREAQIENLQGQIDHLRDKMETTTSQEYLDNMEGWIQEKEERIQDLKAQIEDIRQKLR